MNKLFTSLLFYTLFIALLILIGCWIYRKTQQENVILSIENKALSKFDDPKNKISSTEELNAKVLFFETKYESVNKRFDDLYILGSIIVLLLITINIGLFVNTQSKVDDYFKDNFASHQKQAEEYAKAAGLSLGRIETMKDSIEKMLKTLNEQVTTTTTTTTNGDAT